MDKKRGRPKGEKKKQLNISIREKKHKPLKRLAVERSEPIGEVVEYALEKTFSI